MKFTETKEERIEYLENDIIRLEREFGRYEQRKKYSAVGALLCSIGAIMLTIIQFKIFDRSSGLTAFLIICLVLSVIILIVVAISSSIDLPILRQNIDERKVSLNLMKNDYEKYIENQNKALLDALKQFPVINPDEIHSPKCPICGSYNLSPITPMQKAGKIFLWGVYAAGDVSKAWKCNNCGSKF